MSCTQNDSLSYEKCFQNKFTAKYNSINVSRVVSPDPLAGGGDPLPHPPHYTVFGRARSLRKQPSVLDSDQNVPGDFLLRIGPGLGVDLEMLALNTRCEKAKMINKRA